MEKEQLIEQIENILKSYYGKTNDDCDTGCYVNGRWFSIAAVIRIIKNNLD